MKKKKGKPRTPKAPAPLISRDISWLAFNRRVFSEALRPEIPLLERLKFLAISASNLDEFFMVRVGGLMRALRGQPRGRDAAGLTGTQLLRTIRSAVEELVADQTALFNHELFPALRSQGLRQVRMADLTGAQRRHVEAYFGETVFPVLTPMAVDPDDAAAPVPYLPGLRPIVACELGRTGVAPRHAVIVLPLALPRFVPLPVETVGEDAGHWACVTLEDVVAHYLDVFFPGEEVRARGVFRLTRNGDIPVTDDDVQDLAEEMEEMIEARLHSDVVRLEISAGFSAALLRNVRRLTRAPAEAVYRQAGPLDYAAYMAWTRLPGFESLQEEAWPPQPVPELDQEGSLFDSLEKGDILLHHPYQSFDPVVRFVQEAAQDPDVLAIKQFLYRTGGRSRIVDALITAAEAGKSVTVLVELKARFDEERNLGRAEELRRAGAQIVYGVRGYKVHAKACLVLRRKGGGLKRYAHFGTGNYNEATARLYTDISLLTAREDLCGDLSGFFHAVTARTEPLRLAKLAAAPYSLRQRIESAIEAEETRAREGYPAKIVARLNSLEDPALIRLLLRAHGAGVEIFLNVRGICCLLPPPPKAGGATLEVVSIVDRFLEHSRVFYFHNGGDPRLYISSADWMTRNLDRRLELLTPVEDRLAMRRLTEILETAFSDTQQAWVLTSDGTWVRREPDVHGRRVRSQQELYREARVTGPHKGRRSRFVPHRPSER